MFVYASMRHPQVRTSLSLGVELVPGSADFVPVAAAEPQNGPQLR